MVKKLELVIFGTGPTAEMAHYYFLNDSDYTPVAFTVDREYIEKDSYLDLPVVSFDQVQNIYPPSQYQMFVAMGYERMNVPRQQKYSQAKQKGYTLASYISTRCSWLTSEPVGDNCLIMEDNTIQPFVKIGNNVVLWSGNHIGHRAIIEDHCFITSHVVISGFTRVSSNCFLGVNATIRDGIIIAPYTLAGAGAIIMKDTVERGVYVPERAKLLDLKSDELKIS